VSSGAWWYQPHEAAGLAAGGVAHEAEATLQAVATTTADGSGQLQGEATAQAVATTTADGAVDLLGEAALQAVASLEAEAVSGPPARVERFIVHRVRRSSGYVYISRPKTVAPVGGVIHEAEASLQAVATFASEGLREQRGEASLQGVSTWAADASVESLAEALLQAVATFTSDGAVLFGGEVALQGVATFEADGLHTGVHQGEAALVGVAILTAEGELVIPFFHEGEAELVGVAHMGFDPEMKPRPTHSYRGGHGSFYPAGNRRRVRGSNETSGRRIVSK
jgi:hypothetical protein